MAKGDRTVKIMGGRIIRKAELPPPKKNEINPFLTNDGKLKPGIIPPKPLPKPPKSPKKD